jgi:carboxyl-terminal processing protease
MRQTQRVGWVSVTAISLAAFSFFAGLGLRGLISGVPKGKRAADSSVVYQRFASAAPRVADPDLRPATLYMEVLRKLQLYYVDPLPSNTKLATSSVEAMLARLRDPNTRLLSKAEMDALQQINQGEFPGLGAVLTVRRYSSRKEDDLAEAADEDAPKPQNSATNPGGAAARNTGPLTVTVVSVAPGSPAEKAGLQPGDRITEMDGHWVAPAHVSYRLLTQVIDPIGIQEGHPLDEEDDAPELGGTPAEREKMHKEMAEASGKWKNATDLPSTMDALMGGATGEHELTIERGAPVQTLKVKVTLAPTKVALASSRTLNPGTGYLQVAAMNGDTLRQAREALEGFQKAGVKNLVLDLRNSAGGSIEAARDLAGMLIGEQKFAVVKERDADRKLVERALVAKGASVLFKPAAITVLVNRGTAGSSELLAAALRENAGAKLVGGTTFGDGTEQEVTRLDNGTGVSITHALMLTSKGVEFDGKGLQPDVAAQGDALEAALKTLSAAPAGNGGRA